MGERAKTVERAADSGRVVSIHAADGAPRKGAPVGVRSQIGTPIGSERTASQAQMAQVFGRALGALVRGGAGAAELLGVSQQQVSRWADPQSGLAITLRDINVLAQRCPEFGAALLGALGVLWARTTPVSDVPPSSRTLRLVDLLGQLASTVRDAERDGHLDGRELEAIERGLRRLEAEVSAALADVARRRLGTEGRANG